MPTSWTRALDAYSYPVSLRRYGRAYEFPGFFNMEIGGDRESTIEFENHYQKKAPQCIEAFFEVVYWKMYSQGGRRERATDRIVDFVGDTASLRTDCGRRFSRWPNLPRGVGSNDSGLCSESPRVCLPSL